MSYALLIFSINVDLIYIKYLIPLSFYFYIFSFAVSLGGSFYIYLTEIVPSLGIGLSSVI